MACEMEWFHVSRWVRLWPFLIIVPRQQRLDKHVFVGEYSLRRDDEVKELRLHFWNDDDDDDGESGDYDVDYADNVDWVVWPPKYARVWMAQEEEEVDSCICRRQRERKKRFGQICCWKANTEEWVNKVAKSWVWGVDEKEQRRKQKNERMK